MARPLARASRASSIQRLSVGGAQKEHQASWSSWEAQTTPRVAGRTWSSGCWSAGLGRMKSSGSGPSPIRDPWRGGPSGEGDEAVAEARDGQTEPG